MNTAILMLKYAQCCSFVASILYFYLHVTYAVAAALDRFKNKVKTKFQCALRMFLQLVNNFLFRVKLSDKRKFKVEIV